MLNNNALIQWFLFCETDLQSQRFKQLWLWSSYMRCSVLKIDSENARHVVFGSKFFFFF